MSDIHELVQVASLISAEKLVNLCPIRKFPLILMAACTTNSCTQGVSQAFFDDVICHFYNLFEFHN